MSRRQIIRRVPFDAVIGVSLLALAACGGGTGETSSGAPSPVTGSSPGGAPPTAATPISVYTRPPVVSLSVSDVERVIATAVAEAQARGRPSVIAVVDRVGNVLAVYRMAGAPATATTRPGTSGNLDVQNVTVPAELAAIAKAVTGAYLSSAGNAFSTRTASMIVQEHFPPSANTRGLESGPLFGVQFSQLPCSDFNSRFGIGAAMAGPKRSPLGLAADPGGFPLYKDGFVVGAVGVMGDGDYGFDPEITDIDDDDEEHIALAATIGFAPPATITANRISVDGTLLRYSDARADGLRSNPASAPGFGSLGAAGSLVAVGGFSAGGIVAGAGYGSEASGLRPATTAEFNHPDAFVVSDGAGNNRFPVRAATDAGDVAAPLTQAEVRAVLEEAFKIASRARGQIRQPLDSRAQVSMSVVDTRGAILGLVRGPDAPIFGADVSIQKARSTAFFSNAVAATDLAGTLTAAGGADSNVRNFVPRIASFFSAANGGFNGQFGISNRAIGNVARPYFPDGEVAQAPGPLSRPIAQFSPFSNGLQSALIVQNLAALLGGTESARCTYLPNHGGGSNRLANGLQIFPGGVPIYRGSTLVGAIGVSGDGIDQDDMTAFLGLQNASVRVGGINVPAASVRSDQIIVPVPGGNQVRLRFVGCPFAPFVDTSEQNVCQGL
jgi:uncharacterized protein GlcG (DUF336 family)